MRRALFLEDLLMTRSFWFTSFAMLLTAVGLSCPASAVVTPQVFVNFDGTLTGATYNLALGELDTTGTFSANGSATVSGGLGDIPGDLDPVINGPGNVEGLGTTTGSGFFFYGNLLGPLTVQSWISEALVKLDVPVASQPATFNHVLDVQGDTFYRFDGNVAGPKVTDFGYWDGGNEQINTVPDITSSSYNHVALVWDATATSVEAYLNGVSQGVVDLNAFDVSSPRVGYGFFARFYNRGIDGKLDAVAFSTFDGAFNPATDFQLSAVPEPSSIVLLGIAFAGLAHLRKR